MPFTSPTMTLRSNRVDDQPVKYLGSPAMRFAMEDADPWPTDGGGPLPGGRPFEIHPATSQVAAILRFRGDQLDTWRAAFESGRTLNLAMRIFAPHASQGTPDHISVTLESFAAVAAHVMRRAKNVQRSAKELEKEVPLLLRDLESLLERLDCGVDLSVDKHHPAAPPDAE